MRKSFVSAAIILIAAGFIARLFGFVYRIYLSNIIGAEGMGLYQLVFPVYAGIVLTITAGISISVSKMVAEQKAGKNTANLHRITVSALLLVVSIGTAVSLFIFFNAGRISSGLLGDARTKEALVLIAPCIPAVVAASALKGYFYGIQRVMPTALSQIAEQAVKIGFLILMAGEIAKKDVGYACAVATLSTALGEIANMLFLVAAYAVKRKYAPLKRSGRPLRKRSIMAALLKASLPISGNRLVISAMSAAELIMIPAMLASGGLVYKSSMEIFGRLTGMALPLIMFPSLVTNSLATTLVPAISEAVSLKNFRSVNYRISKSIQASFILGVIFNALFINYPNEIGALLYRHENIGDLLYLLSFSCVFIYLQQTLTGVLNGLGRQGMLLRNTVIGSLLRIAVVLFLVPVYGVRSYAWGLSAGYLLTSILDLSVINRTTGLVFNLRDWLLKPGFVGIVMVLSGKYIYHFFTIFQYGETVTAVLAIVAYGAIACILMMFTGAIGLKEVLNLSGLKK